MAEDALKIRRSAKTRFTRKKNEFFKAEKKGTEILKTKFDELTDAWSTVEGKHDIYLMYLNEEEITANEKWIEELQEEYNEASTVYIKYDNERKALELKEQEELNRQHIITLRGEEFQRIVQQTIMKKKSTDFECTASCESPRFQILHMVYFVQNVQKYRRYKEFEIYVEISTGTTISQEMLKQTVNKNNIHVPVGVSQVSQLVVMILLINDCYVMSLVVIISRMNFVLYRNSSTSLIWA